MHTYQVLWGHVLRTCQFCIFQTEKKNSNSRRGRPAHIWDTLCYQQVDLPFLATALWGWCRCWSVAHRQQLLNRHLKWLTLCEVHDQMRVKRDFTLHLLCPSPWPLSKFGWVINDQNFDDFLYSQVFHVTKLCKIFIDFVIGRITLSACNKE